MRFISLKKRLRYVTCYYRLLNLGSGPNFVLNRIDDFKTMIKDQGSKFWFRFWLNFCFYPEIIQDPLYTSTHTVNVMRILCEIIHRKFLEGSPNDTINYSIETLARMTEKEDIDELDEQKNAKEEDKCKQLNEEKNLKSIDDKKIKQDGQKLKEDIESLATYIQFLFGCALCEVFYIWLEANQVVSSINYWSVPEIYERCDFQPRLIEHYIMHTWGIRIFHLLGVGRRTCPWVNVMMTERQKICFMHEKTCYDLNSQKEIECWNKRLHIMKAKLRKMDRFCGTKRKKEPEKESEKELTTEMDDDEDVVNDNSEKETPRCAFCFNTENLFTKLKKCSLCVNDLKKNPNYYCGTSCQTEDWFRSHAEEHNKLYPYLKIKPSAIERSAETESKIFTLSLFDNFSDR